MTLAATIGRNRAWTAVLVVLALLILLFIAGNAHLLFVALNSRPVCIDHVKMGEAQTDDFTAAQSDC